jgi:tripeptidyl-peptidase-1
MTLEDTVEPVGGTSVSSPTFAGLVSLLNQAALRHSGKTLGFLNPLLYHMYASDPSIFFDIVVGDNKCTEQGCDPACQGFSATPGWDAVTGLGSLNYEKAEAFILNMLDQTTIAIDIQSQHVRGVTLD